MLHYTESVIKKKPPTNHKEANPYIKQANRKLKKQTAAAEARSQKKGKNKQKRKTTRQNTPAKIHKEKKLTYPRNLHKRQQLQTSKARPKITLQHHYIDYNSSVGIHGFSPATIYADQSLSPKSLKGKDNLDRGVAPFSRQDLKIESLKRKDHPHAGGSQAERRRRTLKTATFHATSPRKCVGAIGDPRTVRPWHNCSKKRKTMSISSTEEKQDKRENRADGSDGPSGIEPPTVTDLAERRTGKTQRHQLEQVAATVKNKRNKTRFSMRQPNTTDEENGGRTRATHAAAQHDR